MAPCCYATSDTVTSRDGLIVAFPPAWQNGTRNAPLYADGGGTGPRRGTSPGPEQHAHSGPKRSSASARDPATS